MSSQNNTSCSSDIQVLYSEHPYKGLVIRFITDNTNKVIKKVFLVVFTALEQILNSIDTDWYIIVASMRFVFLVCLKESKLYYFLFLVCRIQAYIWQLTERGNYTFNLLMTVVVCCQQWVINWSVARLLLHFIAVLLKCILSIDVIQCRLMCLTSFAEI